MKLEDVVVEIKEDVKEIKKTVDELVIYMHVAKEKEKSSSKRAAYIAGGIVSIAVAGAVKVIEKLIGA